ncbi:DUF3102 domain-containing protein [Azospirillum picis]|uniref:DUF3102 domain-containing protein n=1 Tax=Azospirillum picis TaxID=488438 RepID=A0ABU0MQZ3_9PROT|nr:DUF3102 domain-containing protein [Azospirillum picis]MBP2302165.1 hypothetical protein [Azospirillum picis]MDQ0535744.1 hypothetical protein [Azospirillum picis]
MVNVKSFMKKAAEQGKAAPAAPRGPAASPASAMVAPSKADRRASDISDAIVPCHTRQEFAQEIRYHWNRSRKEFLSIGRYLNRAKEILPHGDFESMIQSDMPFSVETAFRFRAVAEAVDTGRLSLEVLPGAESVAYQIVTMSPEELERAKAEGLIRPDVTRRQLIEFKRSLRPPKDVTPNDRRRQLLDEYARLASRIAAIREELRRDHGLDPERAGGQGGITIDVEAEDIPAGTDGDALAGR